MSDQERLSYRETRSLVDNWARALLAGGVTPGDRVSVYGLPRPLFMITFLAAASIGAVFVGLSPKYSKRELVYTLDDSRPSILIGIEPDLDPSLLSDLAQEVGVGSVVGAGGEAPVQPFHEFLAHGGAQVDDDELAIVRSRVAPTAPAAIVYTSGSTGRPKGALLTHQGLAVCARVQHRRWVTFEPLRVVCDMPINHVGALGDICCSTLASGGAIYFIERFDPARLLDTFERERITLWFSIPTMLLLATRAPEWRSADMSSLRRVAWSGAPASEELIAELTKLGIPLSTSYGLTETQGSVTYTADGDPVEVLANTIGRADPEFDIRIINSHGNECSPGQTGELVVRGACVIPGYFRRPSDSHAKIPDGWLRTGDLAVARTDGNLRLVGRLSDMYKTGGLNVYCREVEIALERHPLVRLAAVVSVPDELYGEAGHAFIVTSSEEPTAGDLLGFLRDHLANHKIPKKVTFLARMPLLAIGKVDKVTLRRLAKVGP